MSLNSAIHLEYSVKLYLVPIDTVHSGWPVWSHPLHPIGDGNLHFGSWKSPVFILRSLLLFRIKSEMLFLLYHLSDCENALTCLDLGYWNGGETICFLWHDDSPSFARCNYSVPCTQAFSEMRHSKCPALNAFQIENRILWPCNCRLSGFMLLSLCDNVCLLPPCRLCCG